MNGHAVLPDQIAGLLNPGAYPHDIRNLRVVETHISWVMLTGEYAYKIKKAVDFGFLDYSTLEKRKFFCEEELRLNSRFAPDLYLDVVAICGADGSLKIGGDGEVVEYAVRMRQFPQAAQLDRLLDAGDLESLDILTAARQISAYHEQASVATADTPFGTPDRVAAPVMENFRQILPRLADPQQVKSVEALREWSKNQTDLLRETFVERKGLGRIRECHGDLHLSNLIRRDHRVLAFDCIEFDPDLRWTDVLCEIAFLIMDLEVRERDDLAFECASAYLEAGGDYDGVRLLPYYLVYRSLVRAKVAAIRMVDDALDAAVREQQANRFQRHIAIAQRDSTRHRPLLVLCHGLSGSGKTWLSDRLIGALGAIRVRSDTERKRLFGLQALTHSGSDIGAGIYDSAATAATYARLELCARASLEAGLPVIVDAAFLQHAQRERFTSLARELGAARVILHCHADDRVLEDRLRRRAQQKKDASEADLEVLRYQHKHYQPPEESELPDTMTIDTGNDIDIAGLTDAINTRVPRRVHAA